MRLIYHDKHVGAGALQTSTKVRWAILGIVHMLQEWLARRKPI